MATQYGKLALVLLATLMLVMTGCSSEADKAAQNYLDITEEFEEGDASMHKMMEVGMTLGTELGKLSSSEQKAWEKKWKKKLKDTGFNSTKGDMAATDEAVQNLVNLLKDPTASVGKRMEALIALNNEFVKLSPSEYMASKEKWSPILIEAGRKTKK